MRLLRAIGIVIVIAGLALASSGCTAKIENVTKKIALRSGEGPSNVPEYPSANRTSNTNIPLVGQIVTYQSNDSAKQVLEFYRTQMLERGYNITRDTSANETGGLITFVKGQDSVWVAVGRSNGQTGIAIRTSFQR
jgi:hypothetical protein